MVKLIINFVLVAVISSNVWAGNSTQLTNEYKQYVTCACQCDMNDGNCYQSCYESNVSLKSGNSKTYVDCVADCVQSVFLMSSPIINTYISQLKPGSSCIMKNNKLLLKAGGDITNVFCDNYCKHL